MTAFSRRPAAPWAAPALPLEVSVSTVLAGALGLLAVLAVALGVPRLTSIIPSHVPVAANTGLCFVLLALALRAAHAASREGRYVAVAASGIVMLLALITGYDIANGHALGVDRWLFPAPPGASQMSPQTAIAFALLSAGILAARSSFGVVVARISASVVLLLSLVNVLDVLYDASEPTILGGYVQMALPTAVVFFGLALGLTALHPHGSLLELLRLPGPTGTLTRRLTAAALIIPIAVGWLRLTGERAGWYDAAFGVALLTTITIFLFTIAIRITAKSVERAELERRRAEEALNDALAEITDLYDNAPIGYHSLDAEGRYVHINVTELAMLGFERAEILGTRFRDLLTPASQATFAENFPRFLERGFVRDLDFEMVRRDGTTLAVRISATAIRDAHGKFIASRSTLQDISEQREMELERQRALDEAVSANRAKGEFLSRMSHELRTPLNSVLGFAQLLEADDLTAEQRESATYIRRAGRHLLDLINEVLDIARIDQGALTISVEAVALRDSLDEVSSFILPLAAARSISVDMSSIESCPGWVMADRQRLRQVLLNLMSNAVKYNREGGSITVTCRATDGNRLRIDVTDTGHGIPAASLSRLFQPFERLGAEMTGIEGSGMGLALSKALVEAMGGEIGVETEPGTGSTFWVAFQRAQAPEQEVAAVEAAPTVSSDAGPQHDLLYIEDNPANLRLVERIVARMPRVRLLTAIQGGIGLELARQQRPALILLDLHLPDMNGAEVLRLLRGDPVTSDIPVAILSADGSERQVRALMADGADAYLTKPLDLQEFVDVVERLLLSAVPRATNGA